MEYAPIALFVYNRLLHTQNTVQALKANHLSSETNLIIFSDGPRSSEQSKKVESVRNFIKSIDGFKSIRIIERDCNYGLANSIIDGVSLVCKVYGSAIVLEDDIVTAPHFLQFMNDGLNRYKEEKKVASIHGYVYPVQGLPESFFMRGADCWGWATWHDRWEWFEADGKKLLSQLVSEDLIKSFDFNGAFSYSAMLKNQIAGLNNSWAIRWHASAFLRNKLTLYPGKSLVKNIGNDGSGTHSENTDIYTADVNSTPIHNFPPEIVSSELAFSLFEVYFRNNQSFVNKFKQRLKSFLRKLSQCQSEKL